MNIKLLHLYYDIMNLYGDYGNIVILKKHLEDQGLTVTVDKKSIGETIDLKEYSFVFIGSGTERNLDVILPDLKKYKDDLKKYIDDKGIILTTGNSFEAFGKKIDEIDGLDIFDFEVKRDKDRTTSDVIYSSEYLKNDVVGFVNKGSKIYHNMNPFFKVKFGIGENENNDYEGVKYKNFFGTHVSGPILVRNPEFLQKLVTEIAKLKKSNFKYRKIDYENEEKGYELVLNELTKRNQ